MFSSHFCSSLASVRPYLGLVGPRHTHWLLLEFLGIFQLCHPCYIITQCLAELSVVAGGDFWCMWCISNSLMSVLSLVPDPGGYHHVLTDRSGHRPLRPAWGSAEIHWAPDHYAHGGPHWPLWFPGSGRESREALGHRHAVSIPRPFSYGQSPIPTIKGWPLEMFWTFT